MEGHRSRKSQKKGRSIDRVSRVNRILTQVIIEKKRESEDKKERERIREKRIT